jgi:enoyl-CoA hydratase/carnithine racemase
MRLRARMSAFHGKNAPDPGRKQDELLAHAMGRAAALAAKPRAALLATRRLMRGDPEALRARTAEEMHSSSAALKSPEARSAFQAFLSAGRK